MVSTCSTPGCWKTVYGEGTRCGKCLEGLTPDRRGQVTLTELLHAWLVGEVDGGVTRFRLLANGQPIRPLPPAVYESVAAALSRSEDLSERSGSVTSIFLSYAHEHRTAARRIYDCLTGRGHAVWFDLVSRDPDRPLDDDIAAAFQGQAFFVACLSPEILDRQRYVYGELQQALQRAGATRYLYFVPMVVDFFEVPDAYAPYHPIEFSDPNSLKTLLLTIEMGSQDYL